MKNTDLIKLNKHNSLSPFRPTILDINKAVDELLNFDNLWPSGFSLNKFFKDTGDVDIYGDDTKYNIVIDSPGFQLDDIDIDVSNGCINITCEKKEELKEDNVRYYIQSRSKKIIQKSWTLPDNVDTDNIKAVLKEGVLHISIPKIEISDTSEKKKIEILSG